MSRFKRFLVAGVALVVLLAVAGVAALFLLPGHVLAQLGYRIAGERLVTGLLVTGTARRPVLYVTSSDPRFGAGESGKDISLDTNSGVISRLTWTGKSWKRLDLVRGLPRSEGDHASNGVALDLRSKTLYVAQGSNTNLGAPSHNFAYLPEYALSDAILSVDLARIGNRTYDLPTLDDKTRAGKNDGTDPFGGNDGLNQAKLVPGGPVQVYAPGYRNPYDLLLTERGRLYTSANGAAIGWGGTPPGEGPEGMCTNGRHDPGFFELDTLHLLAKGKYGGHPNPTRANRENTFNADRQSPVEKANPVECDYLSPRERGAITTFPTSTNGLAEYTASNFGGALRGEILAASFSNRIYRVKVNNAGDHVLQNRPLFSIEAPLDVTTQSDGGQFPGTIWVAQFDDYTTTSAPGRNLLVFEPSDFETSQQSLRRGATARSQKPEFRKIQVRGTSSDNPTSLQFGPDGRLYVAQEYGLIKAYTVARMPDGRYVATRTEDIDAIQKIPNHNDDGRSVSDPWVVLGKIGDKLGL